MPNPENRCEICGAAADVSMNGRWACADHWREVEKSGGGDEAERLRDEIRRLLRAPSRPG